MVAGSRVTGEGRQDARLSNPCRDAMRSRTSPEMSVPPNVILGGQPVSPTALCRVGLAVGTFLMGSTEFVVAGLLPEVADDLDVSVSRAGLLITAFAAGMIIGPPVMAIATLRLPRRSTLVLALVVFALGHVVAALSSDFTVLLASRVITTLATGAFWCVATVVAASAAGPTATSRALGLLMGGLTVANVFGVPLGSWLGQVSDWRGPIWVLAALSACAASVVARFVPDEPRQQPPSVRAEFAALRQRRVWLVLGFIALLMGGVLATYSYISPLLTERAGVPAGSVPLVLAAYGVGAVLGTAAGGRVGDDRPLATMIASAGLDPCRRWSPPWPSGNPGVRSSTSPRSV